MFRRLVFLVSLVICGAFASALSAAALKMTYTGNDIFVPNWSRSINFSGSVVLDLSAFGGSVAGQTIGFQAQHTGGGDTLTGVGLISWSLGIPLFSVAGSTASFTFDSQSQVSSWSISALDGPPDYVSNSVLDAVTDDGLGEFIGVAPGTWSTTQVVPLPASVLGLGLGLGALAGLARRRSATRSAG